MRTIPYQVQAHCGACAASAAVALGPSMFVAASDEDNILRIYAANQDGPPLAELNSGKAFGLNKRDEADLDGAAWLGSRIFWIGSHVTLDKGVRYRFFASRIDFRQGRPRLRLHGRPYAWLLRDLFDDKRFARLNLNGASRKHPKEEGGLSVDGLAATPKGALLIGMGNPVHEGRAIVAKLKNPGAVVKKGKRCKFGKPVLLDLDGLGIRSIDYWPGRECYLIVAGRHGAAADFRLYRWSGKRSDAPVELNRFSPTWSVEAVIPSAGEMPEEVLVISDDGGRVIGGGICKDLAPEKRFFRSGLVHVPTED